jgi:hypothetical protein
MQEIRKKGITSAKKMFKVTNKHADGQDDVNASMGKYKQRTNELVGEGPSSPKWKDCKCKGNFVGASRSRTIRASSMRS